MPRTYLYSFKKSTVESIKKKKLGTKKTAEKLNIPLKTLEKWITAYNKDPNVFNKKDKIIDEKKVKNKK